MAISFIYLRQICAALRVVEKTANLCIGFLSYFRKSATLFLCIAFFWLGNIFADSYISKMTVAAFIFVSVFFSTMIPACEQLHAKLSSPLDWIVPGFIFACGVIFSLMLFMYIRAPADAVSDLIAHGSRLRPLPITSKDIMGVGGVLLSLLISFSFFRRSKR